MKKIYKVNEEGKYIGYKLVSDMNVIIDPDGNLYQGLVDPDKFPLPSGLYMPRFLNEQWIEGKEQKKSLVKKLSKLMSVKKRK